MIIDPISCKRRSDGTSDIAIGKKTYRSTESVESVQAKDSFKFLQCGHNPLVHCVTLKGKKIYVYQFLYLHFQ